MIGTPSGLFGKDLCFSYDGAEVLRGVSLDVTPGQATVLVGPSGSGKTTLLWLLAGLLRPQRGQVGVMAADGASSPQPAQASGARPPIGMVFQQPALWDHLTAEQHLHLVLAGKGLSRGQRRQRVDAELAAMRLDDLRRRRPGEMSGGQRQRLSIARAMVLQPQWLILDEPLAHLDGELRGELLGLLREAVAQTHAGVVMASHNAAEAMQLADQIVILLDGCVAQAGPPEEVYRRPVSLAAARVLGPACELSGLAAAGTLTCDGEPVLAGLGAELAGPVSMILRPEDVAFQPEAGGPATVERCEFVGGACVLSVKTADATVQTMHPLSLPPGTHGRLALRSAAR